MFVMRADRKSIDCEGEQKKLGEEIEEGLESFAFFL